ncbi:MAG TPA: tripartite tricarboxylate transporter substrate binding protein [Burkholderiales bacterium]|nr:tripartite tricarboxylate transporter substrate binding protein [Burkholderiales bacterium]
MAWKCRRLAALCIAGAVTSGAGNAAYPDKPVRMVVPFPPGGGTDVVARAIALKLGEQWSQSVIVDNRPGAASMIGTEILARSVPDGYTLGFVSMTHTINVSIYRTLPYDPVADFAPIILAASAPNVLVVNPSVGAKTVADLVRIAKARPGRLNFPSSGNGGVSHLSAEMFRYAAGIDITHVPYRGAGPALTALLAGEMQLMMATTPVALPQMKAGRLVALAVTSRERSPLAPELPTISESGYPGFEADTWYGMLAPAKIPPALVTQVNAAVTKMLAQPDFKERLAHEGAQPAGGTPTQFAAYIRSEIDKWAKIVRMAKVKVE